MQGRNQILANQLPNTLIYCKSGLKLQDCAANPSRFKAIMQSLKRELYCHPTKRAILEAIFILYRNNA